MVEYRSDPMGRHLHPIVREARLHVSPHLRHRSLDRDRGEKRAAYARARVPVYWIINLIDRQVEVYSGPSASGYRSSQVYKTGQDVPVVIAGIPVGRLAAGDVLP